MKFGSLPIYFYICTPDSRFARMAESVDALVSNTNVSNDVPVRPRLRVHEEEFRDGLLFFCFARELTALLIWPLPLVAFRSKLRSSQRQRPTCGLYSRAKRCRITHLKGGCADKMCLLLDLRSALLGIRARSQATFDPAPGTRREVQKWTSLFLFCTRTKTAGRPLLDHRNVVIPRSRRRRGDLFMGDE